MTRPRDFLFRSPLLNLGEILRNEFKHCKLFGNLFDYTVCFTSNNKHTGPDALNDVFKFPQIFRAFLWNGVQIICGPCNDPIKMT